MKKLLIVLSLCVFVIGCDDMQKPVMDVIGDPVEPTITKRRNSYGKNKGQLIFYPYQLS